MSLQKQFAEYKKRVSSIPLERPASDIPDLVQGCKNCGIPVYEFNRWHYLRRGKLYSNLPLLVDGWQTLQTDWRENFPGANIGIDYAKGVMDKIGRVPEVITATIYDGSSYVHPGKGEPKTRYLKDMKIIESLMNLGVKNIIVGNAGAEIRFNHIESTPQFVGRSIEYLSKIYKIWGKKLWVAISHPDHYRDMMEGGEIASWLSERSIPNIIMCGYTWLYDLNNPTNAYWKNKDQEVGGMWSEINQKHIRPMMSSYIKTFNAGSGLGGKTGLRHDSARLAKKFGYKFATVSFL